MQNIDCKCISGNLFDCWINTLGGLCIPPGSQLEALKGSLAGHHSIRINDRWRLYFRFEDVNAYDVEIFDYIRSVVHD